MPSAPCPECSSDFVEHVLFGTKDDVDWFRCLRCGHVWNCPKVVITLPTNMVSKD